MCHRPAVLWLRKTQTSCVGVIVLCHMPAWNKRCVLVCLQGEVTVPIGLVQYPGLSSGLFAASPSGKPALSKFKVLVRHQDSTLAEVREWFALWLHLRSRSCCGGRCLGLGQCLSVVWSHSVTSNPPVQWACHHACQSCIQYVLTLVLLTSRGSDTPS